jgi:imidazole glycerol-phosphate synthase subunit HisH
MLALIDYGMGNLRSVYNAFKLLDEDVQITNQQSEISEAEGIILPGVGAFSDGMKNLRELDLVDKITEEVIDKEKPYLGICLGLEFLAEKSFEGGENEGFGWIKANVEKIQPKDTTLKIPHMGWNDTKILVEKGLMNELIDPTFYYLHSYYVNPEEEEEEFVTSVCNYGGINITASFQKKNIFAVQFHPEKSQNTGIKLLKNFLEEIRK